MLIPEHRVVLLGCSLWHKNAIYLRHVADLFLNVLVRGSLLLHLVSQCRQSLVQGIGFPLGLSVTHRGMRGKERKSAGRETTMFTTRQKQASLKFHRQGANKRHRVPQSETKSSLISSLSGKKMTDYMIINRPQQETCTMITSLYFLYNVELTL